MDRHGLLPGDVTHRQIDDFVDCLIGREDAMIAGDLPQRHIHGLNVVGRVNDPMNLF